MSHIIVGTAGHIDHGKTALIRAITGRNTDRLKEEQKRGISIELGFTYFDLPSGERAGIIDVPGHEKFIKNMLAGISGIDIVILVVAADEGIMPQTIEHFNILNIIGIKRGFVAITKTDLVDKDWIDLVEEEIKELVQGSFLEGQAIIRVSSLNRSGIDDVINEIDKLAKMKEKTNIEEKPRLPVDRVFVIQGFGTIVTGTLLSGQLTVGDEVQVYPGEKIARIRSIQVHDIDENVAYSGQRVALNLVGLKKGEIDRGFVIAPIASMNPTNLLDCKITLLKDFDKVIENRTRVRLYIGSKECLCRIIILNKDSLLPGEDAYVQLKLEETIVAKRGDRFIVRFYSPMFTIGGGYVIDPNPKKKKRFDEKVINDLALRDGADDKLVIERVIIENNDQFPTIKDISMSLTISEENIIEIIDELQNEGKLTCFNLTKDTYPVSASYYNKIKEMAENILKEYHSKNPLKKGIPKEELIVRLFGNKKLRVFSMIIDKITSEGILSNEMDLMKLQNFDITLSAKEKELQDIFNKNIKNRKFQLGKKNDIINEIIEESKNTYNKQELENMIEYLQKLKTIIKLGEGYIITDEDFQEAKNIAINYLKEKETMTIGEYRDLIDTNRKAALAILDYLDDSNITIRKDDVRTLNPKVKS